MHYSPHLPPLQTSLRAALSAGLVVAIAEALQLQYPLYALISAVIVTDLSPSKTRQLGVQRLAGSVVGAAVGSAISHFLPSAPWSVGLAILAAMFLSHLLHLTGAAKIAGYICGIVVLDHSDQPWSYAFFRLIETVLGIGVAMLVSLIPKLIPIDKSQQQDS
jgi:uncharacterized membrane protein YgaE (UPF0421/DUF939 family)